MHKLLIITSSSSYHGGVISVLHELCGTLPKHGWQPLLGVTDGVFHNATVFAEGFADTVTLPIKSKFATQHGRVTAVESLIRKTDPDIVLMANIADAYEAVYRCKKAGLKCRFIVAIRGISLNSIIDLNNYSGITDFCVTSGEFVRQACIQLARIPEHRVINIPGGVQIPDKVILPKVLSQQIRLGYAGRLAESDKRIFDLIRLVDQLNTMGLSFRLGVAGDGPDRSKVITELKKRIPEYSFTYHGWLDKACLYDKFFSEIDCILNFSPREGVTIAPREGMINGVVPILSDFLGLRTEGLFLHEQNCLTFPVGDIAQAAMLIKRLLDDKPLFTKLSGCAISSQVGKYTKKGALSAWISVLNGCLETPPGIPHNFRPPQKKRNRLERLGIPESLADRLRFVLGRQPVPSDAGSEWPHIISKPTDKERSEFREFIRAMSYEE